MTEMVYGTVRTRTGEPILPRWWRTVDRWTIVCIFALFGIGLLLGLAASAPLAEKHSFAPTHYVERQALFGAMGLTAMILLSMLPPEAIRRLATLGFVAAFVALALLPIFGQDFGKGATRWYSLGFATLQPSEFLKPVYVVFCAWLIAASSEVSGPPGKTVTLALTGVVVGLLAIQPDFGQSALILFSWGVMYFVAGAPMFFLIALAFAVLGAGMLAYNSSEHFARRIDGFLSTEVDPTTQLGYAANAVREGGFLGVGIGEGAVKWSLPDAHTDFIIAVAAEEFGLLLVLVIIGLYFTVVFRSLARLIVERDPFVRLAGCGLVSIFAVQAMINMGVAVRLLPAKGMTLPFVSYGGSSLLAGGITLGMLLALTQKRPQGAIRDAFRGGAL